ncbi:hypothetical protein [Cupriavidus basilensis]|uniref:hypothetical protein n=1 Tax=Cupriavidus basilensis TaxID=68895 RepID=UPI0020A6211A|nr:hypothetical protein [Cupriavidus basilensis]MCP3024971.1 hypothetical protein [Cupriavidus basilensis]
MHQQFLSAPDLLANPELASLYVEKRRIDADLLMHSLKWQSRGAHLVVANMYGYEIHHELKPCTLHASPVWGELFPPPSWDMEPVVFETFDCFVAYVLATWH